MNKYLICKCCEEPIDEDTFDSWGNGAYTDGKNAFCSEECIARWYGSPMNESCDTYEEAVKEYGVNKKGEKPKKKVKK